MGSLDQLLGGVLGEGQVRQGQMTGLAQALMRMLSDPGTGGIDGLVRQFQAGGHGETIASWISPGHNRPISADDLSRTLGQPRVDQLSEQAGLPTSRGAAILAALLPVLIDKLTPDGQVPQQSQLAQLGTSLLRTLLA
jgi:uncharacterized protein YidB (DUF937 family)